MGLTAGLTLSETLDAAPGFVIDVFVEHRRYDDELHGIKRKNPCAKEAI